MNTLRFSFHATFKEAGGNMNGSCAWLLYDHNLPYNRPLPYDWHIHPSAAVWVKVDNYGNVDWDVLYPIMMKMRRRCAEIIYTN
jgi:hypothetical protein